MKDKGREPKMSKQIVGYDANALYLWANAANAYRVIHQKMRRNRIWERKFHKDVHGVVRMESRQEWNPHSPSVEQYWKAHWASWTTCGWVQCSDTNSLSVPWLLVTWALMLPDERKGNKQKTKETNGWAKGRKWSKFKVHKRPEVSPHRNLSMWVAPTYKTNPRVQEFIKGSDSGLYTT